MSRIICVYTLTVRNKKMKKTIPIIVFTVLGTILLVGFAPISSLSVTGLKETYLQGEPVTFVISQNGCGISCDFF